MGIFGVNMPSLYGEGEGAFLRLQLEILSISDDESQPQEEAITLQTGQTE